MSDRDELIEKFTKHEVETTEEILRCLRGPVRASMFRRLLLLFLRGHYSSPANYMDYTHLGCFHWSPNNDSTLAVEYSHGEEDDLKPDDYPGIFVGFATLNYEQIALGNFAGFTEDRSGRELVKGTTAMFKISHVAKTAEDALDLAEMTAIVLTAMARPLAGRAGATGFEVSGLGNPTRKKASPDSYYTVAATVQIQYSMAATLSIESHRIRAIQLSLPTTTS